MSLTAIEIKQQEFAKTMRGCDPAEVKAFLNLTANEWEHLSRKNKELSQKIDDLEEKLAHYKKVEQDLHETLKNARESVQTKLDSAEQQAEHTIEKAEIQANSIVRDAEQERKKMHSHVLQLHNRRREISGSIRSYLKAAIESLDHFDREQNERFDPPAETSGNTASSEPDKDSEEKQKPRPDQAGTSYKAPATPGAESIDDLIDGLE